MTIIKYLSQTSRGGQLLSVWDGKSDRQERIYIRYLKNNLYVDISGRTVLCKKVATFGGEDNMSTSEMKTYTEELLDWSEVVAFPEAQVQNQEIYR